jgi:hypothetical protein
MLFFEINILLWEFVINWHGDSLQHKFNFPFILKGTIFFIGEFVLSMSITLLILV